MHSNLLNISTHIFTFIISDQSIMAGIFQQKVHWCHVYYISQHRGVIKKSALIIQHSMHFTISIYSKYYIWPTQNFSCNIKLNIIMKIHTSNIRVQKGIKRYINSNATLSISYSNSLTKQSKSTHEGVLLSATGTVRTWEYNLQQCKYWFTYGTSHLSKRIS